MAYEIIWTSKAQTERQQILEFWAQKNSSKAYSIKLDILFVQSIQKLSHQPIIAGKTDFKNVRVKVVREYLIFFEIIKKQLVVLSVWDGRRDSSKL